MKYFIVTLSGKRHLIAAKNIDELNTFGDFTAILELKADTFSESGFVMTEK